MYSTHVHTRFSIELYTTIMLRLFTGHVAPSSYDILKNEFFMKICS